MVFFLNSHLCNGTRWFGETTMKIIAQGLEEWPKKNLKKLLFYVQMFILFMKKSINLKLEYVIKIVQKGSKEIPLTL